MKKREKLSSRLGFIFLSAGCAIGLGNIWRFPYVTGKYGGGAFVLIYILFLILLGLPIVIMEFSIGRSSQLSIAKAIHALERKGQKWHLFSYFGMAGNYLLVMFYTTISGWMLAYLFKMLKGDFNGLNNQQIQQTFQDLQASPQANIFWMAIVVLIGFAVCSFGLQKGVEKITKLMMGSLLAVMLLLVIKSFTLPSFIEGVKFYLVPDFTKLMDEGLFNAIYAAMGQAFFTLSIGIGGMTIFASYLDKKRTLAGESINIMVLDTFVALTAGLIIFPACFSFGVDVSSGPGLVFVTLPNIFNAMGNAQLWGTLFFVFMNFAALSTIIAVFENIVSFSIDKFGCSRKVSVMINLIVILILSIPAAIGFNLLSSVQPLGPNSTILDFEDFLVSNIMMPIGALVFVFFCTRKMGWGWKSFMQEVNSGKGLKFPEKARFYVSYLLPIIIIFIFIAGLIDTFIN
ncbi:MAG: sodium-dependent transporter [Erysipelotrichaceae bacterium]|nr:sodium-dependent transporter [Erysipelotrichaceae bacterium]